LFNKIPELRTSIKKKVEILAPAKNLAQGIMAINLGAEAFGTRS
jgi:hypothetical protein